ncbi:MAG: hypothetical protein MJ116_07910 [Lachnospiraceae bacterium]|nr:hypothetical protein [Lachnospiraceae bacterium]
MDNLLRKIESEDVVIYRSHVYSPAILRKCRGLHAELVKEGKLTGSFDADSWIGYSGIKRYGIDFSMDPAAYRQHAWRVLRIGYSTMINMLRCYAIYCTGVYVYNTISSDKVGVVREFLQCFGGHGYKQTVYGAGTIEDFLGFIGTPDELIRDILSKIGLKKVNQAGQRTLSPVINYLAIENEINRIYREDPDDETFRRWFPIYFWVNITFILPLRATEMLVTPKECIQRDTEGRVFLTVRRTKLKKGHRTVYYEVEKDYEESTYEIPDTTVVVTIEKYQRMTADQERRFLFEYNSLMINEMFSLNAFNHLLRCFMIERIIGNPCYDFAKYAAGIDEFEFVSAGDSRPIAMANLYFQNAGEDICRQLANHVHINTSSGYYTNISETIWASSVIRLQRQMDFNSRQYEEAYQQGKLTAHSMADTCLSERRMADRDDISDCIKEGHLEECMGCRYYRPSEKSLEEFMEMQKKRADDGAKRMIEFMNNTMKAKGQSQSMEELFLATQTDACRYRMGCNLYAKEKYEEWQEHRNTPRNCF